MFHSLGSGRSTESRPPALSSSAWEVPAPAWEVGAPQYPSRMAARLPERLSSLAASLQHSQG